MKRLILLGLLLAVAFGGWRYPPSYARRLYLWPGSDSLPWAVGGVLRDTAHYRYDGYLALFGSDTSYSLRAFLGAATGKGLTLRLVGGTADTTRIDSLGVYTTGSVTGKHYGDGSNLTGITAAPSSNADSLNHNSWDMLMDTVDARAGGGSGDSSWVYSETDSATGTVAQFTRFRGDGSLLTGLITDSSWVSFSADTGNITGGLTAARFRGAFIGNVTGNVTGNLTGTADTALGTGRLGGVAASSYAKLLGSGSDSLGNYLVMQATRFRGALIGNVTGDVTGNATTADSSKGGAARATLAASASLLQGKDTTALWNAKTLQGKDTTAKWPGGVVLADSVTALPDSIAGAIVQASRFRGHLLPVASSATTTDTLKPNADAYGQYCLTALAGNLVINAPTGTPADGWKLIIRLEDNATARDLTWNTAYVNCGATLPDSTTASKKVYVGLIYNAADSKWDCVAVSKEE
jgi:hypothetical protein